MKIRKAMKKDFKRIAELYKQGFSEKPYNENWTFKEALDKINLFSKYCDIYVSLIDEKIVGFIIINPNHWHPGEIAFCEEIVVDKNFRGKRIAKKLLFEIEEIYRAKGYNEFMAIVNKKSGAYKLWRKREFRKDKENVLISKDL